MKTRRQRISGALVLLLGGIAAVCLTGCGEPRHGLTAYRDKQVEVPAAKTGVKAGAERAPQGNLCIINVRRDGSLWTQRRAASTATELPALIAGAHAGKGCLVLRCDQGARWGSVVPLLIMVAKARIPRLWFCVEDQGEAFVDYELPVEPSPDVRWCLVEWWIRVRCSRDTPAQGASELFFNFARLKDWENLGKELQRTAALPGTVKDPVVLDVEKDALFGWVIRAVDYVRETGFCSIRFLKPPPPLSELAATPPSRTPTIEIPWQESPASHTKSQGEEAGEHGR